MSKQKGKQALGKGLGAILEQPETDITSTDISGNYVSGAIAHISMNQIETNPFQPRDKFEQEALEELASSIREYGIIQPITVRKIGYDKYQLISGERRYRACKMAGLDKIPAYIRVADDEQMLQMAIVENIQRENLNPIEIALGYKRLIEECDLSHEELADKVGKNRTTVTNFLRLLKLPIQIQNYLKIEQLSIGHARALIALDSEKEQVLYADKIIEQKLSVRQIETLIKNRHRKPAASAKSIDKEEVKSIFNYHQKNIEEKFNAKVKIQGDRKGKISFSYSNIDELKQILEKLGA